MKISEKIHAIIADAHEEFAHVVTPHNNDNFSVGIYFQIDEEAGDWNVWLSKPTKRTLDAGELWGEGCKTSKVSEEETRFLTAAPTLTEALNELHKQVLTCNWED